MTELSFIEIQYITAVPDSLFADLLNEILFLCAVVLVCRSSVCVVIALQLIELSVLDIMYIHFI
jgi:hypothetical protein